MYIIHESELWRHVIYIIYEHAAFIRTYSVAGLNKKVSAASTTTKKENCLDMLILISFKLRYKGGAKKGVGLEQSRIE